MGLKTWALRRAFGRFRITDDIVRHLSTFQRLGETVEVELPGELLPVGARTVFRALRTRAAAQLGVDWVWPHWLERQLDPDSPAFIPRGHLPVLTNLTGRNWTMVGSIGSEREAIVDPRGLVTPWFDGWSLDWWIGADDRWHFPSRDAGVRQRLVDNAPVVETAMRVPSGDAVQRVYAVPGEEDLVVVEIENRSPIPFAVALAVRPYNPEGLAVVERIRLVDDAVTVDGRPALLFPKRPARMAGSTFHEGDVVETVTAGAAGDRLPEPLRCDVGLATAAFIFPLAHTAVLRVAVPLSAERRTRRAGLTRRRVERMPSLPKALPTSDEVARGWAAQARRGMRLELPEGRLADAVEANRRYMLLFHDGADITPGPYTYHRFWFRDAAYMVVALDRYGFHKEAAEVIASFPSRQHIDGFYFSQRQEWDANGAALWAMAEHWRLTRDLACIDAESVAKGVRWIERKRHAKRRRKDPALTGLLPASVSAEHLGPFDYFYWDDFWSLRGLLDGALLLDAAGVPEAAAAASQWAGELRADLDRSMQIVAERLGTAAVPAGPRRRVDPGLIGSLVACYPLRLLEAEDPRMAATAETVRERFTKGPAFFQGISHTGLGTYLTLQLAFVELEAGDRRALDRLQWLLDAATPTFTWPEAIHPQLGGGCMGDGHHGWAAADFLSFVRSLLVREDWSSGGDGLVLCSMLPDAWVGQGIEVHDAPTHFGRVSFAVRWHGDRPALLWELDAHDGLGPVRITAPGLDPAWSSEDRRGEALLSAGMAAR
ncbi:MAG TPA: hypothetical protein VGO92_10605 [Acidimicrobiales bacterium]|jgi:hypothetical protein|nr:hypothetical protein [Acidimicrobiales bacterium]